MDPVPSPEGHHFLQHHLMSTCVRWF